MSKLPVGWRTMTLTQLAGPNGLLSDGDWIESKDQDPSGNIRLTQLADIGDGKFINKSRRYVNKETACRLRCTFLEPGDVLIARMPDPLGRACILPDIGQPAITAVDVFIWRPDGSAAELQWLMYAVNSPDVREKLQDEAGGTTRQRVAGGKLKNLAIPTPPLPEQRRIVVKLDSLTGCTARARDELGRIPKLIQNCREAILAAAFRGELTREWRETKGSEQSARIQLLAIREQRQRDRKLARRHAIGARPKIELPECWEWVSPDEVAGDRDYSIGIGPFGSNLVRSDYRAEGVRLVFVRDIRRERFENHDARYVSPEKAKQLHQHMVHGGEVLITKMGEPPGDTALFPEGLPPAVITADCIKLAPHSKLALAQYLVFCIRSEIVRAQVLEITAGVAQQKVSLDRFRRIALPIPPVTEQHEIVRRIQTAFAWLDRITAEHANASRLLPRLDQTILGKAFRGELVPQDPKSVTSA